jgi:riboflavin synthase
MFSGIIEAIGRIAAIEDHAGDKRFSINAGTMDLNDIKAGDSICVNGVCLTVTDCSGNQFTVDVSVETLDCTTFNEFKDGSKVNLEKALCLSDRLHGHLVTGHVDGVGTIKNRKPDARSERIDIDCPPNLLRYVSKKGSVCIDGVSLTVNEKSATGFSVNIIPHTLEQTIISNYTKGTRVNIEVDIIARYLESLMLTV